MEQLPTNILIKIFECLNNHDLISISMCCKKFYETTTNFMAIKFPPVRIDFQYLYFNKLQKFVYKDEKDFNFLIDSTRHYQNYILINFNKEHTDRLENKWLQLFKKQINTRTIRINSDLLDLHQLNNLLNLTHRLIYLEIDGYRIAKTNDAIDKIPQLPSLKHLKINSFLDTTPQLFIIFQKCQTLKTICLSSMFMVSKKIDSINDLVFNQRELEHLSLIGLDTHGTLFNSDKINEISYSLKKINVEYNEYSMNLTKFSEFFTSQKMLKEVCHFSYFIK